MVLQFICVGAESVGDRVARERGLCVYIKDGCCGCVQTPFKTMKYHTWASTREGVVGIVASSSVARQVFHQHWDLNV